MKNLLKLVLGICVALSLVHCTSDADQEIFDETRVAIEEDAKTLGGGEGEHDYCRGGCE
ncbi:hypothetical protein [Tunicatimonas pelagia]|uniref:hypothetical protein n=1 Tax=Tunicatimonas pelagia TaxID=931531 RepID=UPI00266596C0|nr:hypothetical protein [Tunicatimonas pelagia]WKN45258.1 hypothetical protein P0M28_09840 [Tunicatimonas pelagia]